MVASHGKVLKSFDQGQKPSLLLDFARRKSLIDQVSKTNLITFTRATAATYVGADGLIKTAASGEARFDHNPVTGESLGLLIEERRANLLTYSEQFDNAAWAKFDSTITANAAIAPSGLTTADKFVPSTSAAQHYMQIFTSSTTSQCTGTLYVKLDGSSVDKITIFPGGSGTFAHFNMGLLSTTAEANVVSTSISSAGNGWYRISATWAAGTVVDRIRVYASSGSLGVSAIAGDGVSGIYLWGAQIEVGSFPTSYIPTTTAAATRNEDRVKLDGANFTSWYNQNEGSFLAEYQRPFDAKAVGYVNPRVFKVGDVSVTPNRFSINTNTASGLEAFSMITGNVQQVALLQQNPLLPGENTRCSASYKTNDIAFSKDGDSVLTDNSANIYTSMDRLIIGSFDETSTTQYIHNGTIKRLIYWPTRLDNSDLQEATR